MFEEITKSAAVGKEINRGYLFFSVKDRNLFHRVDTIGNIFTRGCDRNLFHRVDTIGNIFTSGTATSENITDGVHSMK